MNIALWIVQILLALHTVMGALWKLSNSEQAVPSLDVIPHAVWMALVGFELACALALVVPALRRVPAVLVPLGAAGVAAEMLMFSGVHLASGAEDYGPVVYWLLVVVICAFVAYGRILVRPLR